MKREKLPSLKRILDSSLPRGRIELNDTQIENLKNAGEVILGLGAAAGAIAITLLAPNALRLINKMSWSGKTYRSLASKRRDQRRTITRTFYYLRRQSYIKFIPKDNSYLVEITRKGRKKIMEIKLRNLCIKKPDRWDGSWWVVIGDIPVKLRSQANSFRKKLKALGVCTLQRSVWVYPYDPRNEISFLAALIGIEKYITTFRATDLENEDEASLKKFFDF